jgi:hypothetical protein
MKQIKTVGIVAALGATPALLAVPSNAGAASAPHLSVAGAQAGTLPATTIGGNPASFTPKSLTATAIWDGSSDCTSANGSFQINNSESVKEKVTLSNPSLGSLSTKIPAGSFTVVCVTSGFTGVIKAELKDGKTAKAHF